MHADEGMVGVVESSHFGSFDFHLHYFLFRTVRLDGTRPTTGADESVFNEDFFEFLFGVIVELNKNRRTILTKFLNSIPTEMSYSKKQYRSLTFSLKGAFAVWADLSIVLQIPKRKSSRVMSSSPSSSNCLKSLAPHRPVKLKILRKF